MPQAQRISSALWEAQRSRITELYVNQDKTLDEVIQIMAETNFHATKPQYIRKVNVNWKLQKNYTKEKWRHAGVLVEKRQAEGKLTELSIDGKVISEKRRKKELRRYHALQVGENFASTNTCGVVAPTPPSSNSKVVLISHLPWLNFRESFNNLINDRHPLFNPNQQDGSVNFWEVANPLLRIAHNDGEMTIGNLALQEPPKPATDLVSMNLEITQQRLHELMPTLMFLCSNNLTGTERSTYELLQIAISSGFLVKMKHLLTTRGPTVEIFAVYLLFVALRVEGSKGMEFLRFLLESGVSPDSIDPNDYRYSALHRAVRLENRAAVQLLLHFGADPDAKMQGNREERLGSPLSFAVDLRYSRTIAEMLIGAGADTNLGPDKPLIRAARRWDTVLVIRLLEVGADPMLLPAGGLSMIYFAIASHNLDLVNMMIETGVNPNLSIEELQITDLELLRDEFRFYRVGQILTPIQFAVLVGPANIVKRLIEGGAVMDQLIEPDVQENRNQPPRYEGILTPLQMSIQQNWGDITKILLDAGATIDYRHPTTATALQMACGLSSPDRMKTELIEVLLAKGADINALPGENGGRTTIQAAVECGDHELLKLLLSKGGDLFASSSKNNGLTVFQAALRSGSAELMTYVFLELGSQGGSANCVDGTNYLLEAISTGNKQILGTLMMSWNRLGLHWHKEYILSAAKVAIRKDLTHLVETHIVEFLDHVPPSITQEDVNSMICECIWSGDHRTFDLLMHGSIEHNLDCAQSEYPTPLWLAIHEGKHYMAQCLINAGANPNQESLAICRKGLCCDIRLEMPLNQAILQLDSKFMEILLDKGADPNKVGLLDERTALGLALHQDVSLSKVQLLIHHGSDVNKPSVWGTPLEQVAREAFHRSDALQICQLLLSAGADLAKFLVEVGANVNTSSIRTSALQLAVSNNNLDLVNFFLDEGASVDASVAGQTALQTAANLENLELVKNLIDRGADTDAKFPDSLTTALQYAAMRGNIEIVKYLVDNRASVNEEASPYYNATALGLAVVNNHTRVAIFLIEKGASIDANPALYGGATLLQIASRHGNHEIVTCLVGNGAAVNAAPATERGATALQFAAVNGNIKMAVLLLENGAHVSAKGAEVDGRTALEGAAEHGRLDMVYLLLENDEEPETIEERCHDAAKFAEAEYHDVIARILRDYKRP
ncbi:ankyrin repeat-containing domain protein [Fusarium oxysporum f. sp. albedinis]|nr:ankyrin repeat-containing domain protein [Fusarium oxysporum f. sp. albedinis]